MQIFRLFNQRKQDEVSMQYRNLNDNEIEQLQARGCQASNWEQVKVAEPFNPEHFQNVKFAGQVKIGKQDQDIDYGDGFKRTSGVRNATIRDCKIGDNVFINEVTNLVNYEIADKVLLEDIGTLVVTGETSFGNGTKIEILNEGGGRELPIFDQLNAQLAYMLVHYQHDQKLIKKLQTMINDRVQKIRSDRGSIGEAASIRHTTWIENVKIGAATKIVGAKKLENGTIVSSQAAPVEIENCALADNFIIQEGSYLGTDTVVDNCFLGQAVTIDKQFSAENSAFFANSGFFHGEGCSIFAGPYSVSHHKSSLLIAGMFSFYNAGSGTNQSNHMYKLGPVHQGILARGCKTGSFSYLLWPSKVGPFSAVMGKHTNNFDVSEFPFSYIEKIDGQSVLSPAMNLITVGTRRDSRKWPNRDKRNAENLRDLINFSLFSPYTVGKILSGLNRSKELYQKASKKLKYVSFGGVKIKRLLLRAAKKYYRMPIKIFIGDQLIKQIDQLEAQSFDEIKKKLDTSEMPLDEKWIDMAGMLAPAEQIDSVIKDITSGNLNELGAIQARLIEIHEQYDKFAWQWTASLIKQEFKSVSEMTGEDFVEIINEWEQYKVKLNKMILRDAEKEFDQTSKIGYGIDGDEKTRDADFENVRGKLEEDGFVQDLEKENKEVEKQAEHYRKILQN